MRFPQKESFARLDSGGVCVFIDEKTRLLLVIAEASFGALFLLTSTGMVISPPKFLSPYNKIYVLFLASGLFFLGAKLLANLYSSSFYKIVFVVDKNGIVRTDKKNNEKVSFSSIIESDYTTRNLITHTGDTFSLKYGTRLGMGQHGIDAVCEMAEGYPLVRSVLESWGLADAKKLRIQVVISFVIMTSASISLILGALFIFLNS